MSGGPEVVDVSRVSHRYGDVVALDDVSLTLRAGEFAALLGNNGAGKSTLFSILAGLGKPSAGTATWADPSVSIGYAPQDLGIYPQLTVRENLELFAGLNGIPRAEVGRGLDAVVEPLFLGSLLDRQARELSGGEKRRVHTAAALVHAPAVALLDEPTVGVDPETRESIMATLKDLAARGTTILYSTHYFGEVEPLSPRVLILDHGHLLVDSPYDELLAGATGSTLELAFSADLDEPPTVDGYVATFEDDCLRIQTSTPEDTLAVLLARDDWPRDKLRAVTIRGSSLEDVFARTVGWR